MKYTGCVWRIFYTYQIIPTLHDDLNERARLLCCIYDILLSLLGDILWPILTDRQKYNCSVKIKESRVSRTEGIELGSYTFL